MELHQLKYFQSVARSGSITKAAELEQVSQPSVSIAIKKLEGELGVKLLDRTGKKCALTAEGRIFFQKVNSLLVCLQDAVAEVQDYHLSHKGSIKVGITPIMGMLLFPHAFADFQKQNPEVNVTIAEEGSLLICKQLKQGDIDLGIMITNDLPSSFNIFPIISGPLHVCLPHDDPLCKTANISLRDLRNHSFILFKEDTYTRKLILEECAKLQFSPRIVFSSNQIGTVLNLVEQGMGISFFFEEIVRDHREIFSSPLAEQLTLQFGLVWNRKRYLSKTARLFIESVQKTFSSQNKSSAGV